MLQIKSNYTKLIIKLLLSVALLGVMGVMINNNFIKDTRRVYIPPVEEDTSYIYSKFNLDFFEDKDFKSLIKSEMLNTSTLIEVGRDNPFLKF